MTYKINKAISATVKKLDVFMTFQRESKKAATKIYIVYEK